MNPLAIVRRHEWLGQVVQLAVVCFLRVHLDDFGRSLVHGLGAARFNSHVLPRLLKGSAHISLFLVEVGVDAGELGAYFVGALLGLVIGGHKYHGVVLGLERDFGRNLAALLHLGGQGSLLSHFHAYSFLVSDL